MYLFRIAEHRSADIRSTTNNINDGDIRATIARITVERIELSAQLVLLALLNQRAKRRVVAVQLHSHILESLDEVVEHTREGIGVEFEERTVGIGSFRTSK